MDFKSFLGKVAQLGILALEKTHAKMEYIEQCKAQFESLDDQELIRKYKSTSGDQQLACAMLLKERGYGKKD